MNDTDDDYAVVSRRVTNNVEPDMCDIVNLMI